MQLVQTSAHDVRVQVDSLRRARQQDFVLGGRGAVKGESKETFLSHSNFGL